MKIITSVFDPPWAERGGGRIKRGADRWYPVMKKEDICLTILEDSPWLPHEGQSVWMWATVNHLPDAMWLMDRLGVRYVTNAVWVKAKDRGRCSVLPIGWPEDPWEARHVEPEAPGLGQRLRCCHEHLLYGRIGRVPVPPTQDRLPSTIYAPKGRHSAKPQEAFDLIARHDQHSTRIGRKLDLFARAPREGWEVWGNDPALDD